MSNCNKRTTGKIAGYIVKDESGNTFELPPYVFNLDSTKIEGDKIIVGERVFLREGMHERREGEGVGIMEFRSYKAWEEKQREEDRKTFVKYTDVKDNLTSTDTDKPLSANQGKVLNETIESNFENSVKKTDIAENLQGYDPQKVVSQKDGTWLRTNLNEKIDLRVKYTDVKNNLTSTDTDKPLSANQGKVLNETKLNKSDVIDNVTTDNPTKALSAKRGKLIYEETVKYRDVKNNLTSTDTDKPLSANQGKVLNETKLNKSDVIDNLDSTDTDKPLSALQGHILDNDITGLFGSLNFKVDKANIANDLNQTDEGKVLDARQGKVLHERDNLLEGQFAEWLADRVGDYKTSARQDDHPGWLVCDGRALSRTTYSALFGIIATNFGNGDGSTTFNLPDFRGRAFVMQGKGSGLTERTIGEKIGEEKHTLNEAELPSHTHGITDPSHTHATGSYDRLLTYNGLATASGTDTTYSSLAEPNLYSSKIMSRAHTGITINPTGGNAAHENMQPSLVGGNVFIYGGVVGYPEQRPHTQTDDAPTETAPQNDTNDDTPH